MARLNGRWKTGQKIMDNLDLLKFKLKEFKQISEICVLYVYDIDFSGQTGVMHIYTKFDKVLNETFLNCGFSRDLTISKDRTLLFLANYLLENTKKQQNKFYNNFLISSAIALTTLTVTAFPNCL